MIKKNIKYVWAGVAALVVVIGLVLVTQDKVDEGLGIAFYDADGNMIKTVSGPEQAIVSHGGISTDDVAAFKLFFTVTNTGEVPLTVRISDGMLEWTYGDSHFCYDLAYNEICHRQNFIVRDAWGWVSSDWHTHPSSVVQAGDTYTFETTMIPTDGFVDLPQPVHFGMGAFGYHPDIAEIDCPFASDEIVVLFEPDEIVVGLEANMDLG